MTTPEPGSRAKPGITRISVEGYKSLRARHEIEIRPLTVLAGVNSSGKSSAMQPLLLLKQTLDAPYDPGPLRLSGDNVDVTAIEQVLSRPTAGNGHAWFRFAVTISGRETKWMFGRDQDGNVRILEMTGWYFPGQAEPVTLREGVVDDQLRNAAYRGIPGSDPPTSIVDRRDVNLSVIRERCFLFPQVTIGEPLRGASIGVHPYRVLLALSEILHLPAQRSNPRRTYPTVAVRDRFPGTFDNYTAGVIAAWQSRRDNLLTQLPVDLMELGLTWKVEARKLDDTQVELVVGRLPSPQEGGDQDLVNIADVGFGVSQTLPVIVALLAAGPGQLVFLEQPEIHLHPRAQVAFANLLRRAVDRGARVVVETHSALLVRAVQTLVAKQELRPEDVVLHWFSRNHRTGDTEIATAELDESGAFGDWPEDFDEVYLESEARYLDAAAQAGSGA